ncbi:MAG: hypothetical protein KKF77_08235 [Proteobacteria bacterium]|nr:hypothetical protein [Pseudomonadota bacterium]
MDLALAERENTILGQDFLTWLWHVTEARRGVFKDKDGREFNLRMEERLSVQGGDGEGLESAVVKSPSGELTEARSGLRSGKKVSRAQLRFERDPEAWQLTLKDNDFSLSGLKTPKIETNDRDDVDPDARVLEKLFLVEQCLELLDGVYQEFLVMRLATAKWTDEMRSMREWIGQGQP